MGENMGEGIGRKANFHFIYNDIKKSDGGDEGRQNATSANVTV